MTLSHEVGGLGLLERENAAILNAALRPLAARTLPQMRDAVRALHLTGAFFLTAGDGTLISFETAATVLRFILAPLASLASWFCPTSSAVGSHLIRALGLDICNFMMVEKTSRGE